MSDSGELLDLGVKRMEGIIEEAAAAAAVANSQKQCRERGSGVGKNLSVSIPIPGHPFQHRRNNSVTSVGSSSWMSGCSGSGGPEVESGSEEQDLEEGPQPLDLSCPWVKGRTSSSSSSNPTPTPTPNDITRRFLFHCEVQASSRAAGGGTNLFYYERDSSSPQEDSDDSDGQPMDLGINPKAYKKSLMKRYRKSQVK